jgi:hypothetical protein
VILTWMTFCFLLLLLIFIPVDIHDFYADKQTYALVYHLDTGKPDWEWDYILRWTYPLLFIVTGLTIMSFRLTKRNSKLIRIINRVFLVIFFCAIIVGFYTWMRTGFDH